MSNFGIDLATQQAQMDELELLLALAEFQTQGIQLNTAEYNLDEFTRNSYNDIYTPATDDFPPSSLDKGEVQAANRLANQFHFEEKAVEKGLTLPLTGNLTFNWYADNQLLGTYSAMDYDLFCLPMVKKYRNQAHNATLDWNAIPSARKGFQLSLLEWMTDTTFLAHGGWHYNEAFISFMKGSVEFALDGSHRTLSKYGKLFDINTGDDTLLFYQNGFLSVETASEFTSQSQREYDWYAKYKIPLEGTFTNLLSASVLHIEFHDMPYIDPLIGGHTTSYDNYWNCTPVAPYVENDFSIQLANASAENGKIYFSNDSWGDPDPRESINLRDDASIEVHIKDVRETTTSGMPRIIFWGADALPANASIVPAVGWCLQWDTSYAQFELFKDGVSQGTGALPTIALGDVDFWVNIIAEGASNYLVYFDDTLVLTVARTYTFTDKYVGFYAYNWDGGAGTVAIVRLIEFHMATIGRLAGGVRKIRYDAVNSLLFWIDKHGIILQYDIAANTYIKVTVTGMTAESWWGLSDDQLWLLRDGDKYLQGLNRTTLASEFTDDRSAEADFLGYSCMVDKANTQLIVYEKENFLTEYETIADNPFTRVTVPANYPIMKTSITTMTEENPLKHDSNGWLRGQRYWHSRLLLTDTKYASREIIWSPTKKNLVVLGNYETAANPSNEEFCWVIAQEPEGRIQTGRVWAISPVPSIKTAAIEVVSAPDAPFMYFDEESVYRIVFTGAYTNTGNHDYYASDWGATPVGGKMINVRGVSTVRTYSSYTRLSHNTSTAANGVGMYDIWYFRGFWWYQDFSSSAAPTVIFHTGAGCDLENVRGVPLQIELIGGGFREGSQLEVWKYPVKGYGDDNYHMG